MTTFQAIVFGAIHGISEFLPISASAHSKLVPFLLGWPEPAGAFAGAMALGALLALLIYFRHDWASMTSCFLQVLIFRKKPMTLDERMPIFIAIAALPVGASWYYLRERVAEMSWTPPAVAGVLAAAGVLLWLSDYFSRRTKGMFDWNWLDSAIVGITSILMLIPGAGRISSSLPGALLRNYSREAAAKFSLFVSLPVLVGSVIVHLRGVSLHSSAPMEDLSWLSFFVAVVVTLLAGLLAIGGFMRNTQRRGFGQYVLYRLALAAFVVAAYWYRGRGGG